MSDKKNTKLWGGRFTKSSSDVTERLSQSIDFDSRLYKQDIRGSKVHASMLNKIGVLSNEECEAIHSGLEEIELEIGRGEFEFKHSLEDIHMNIEASLTERIGDAGKKLHTGRSRNDQVATDVRLYIKDESEKIEVLIKRLIEVIINLAEKHIDVVMPGYTHLQVAQPVRFSHHVMAYAWKFSRDLTRLHHAVEAADSLPLGSGALAGVNYENDREYLREHLGFSSIIINSMDGVSDRDFVLDFLHFASVLGTHLSRFCEELILWSSSQFNFIRLSDSVTTGSSIMPQKKNPDVAELVRGKTGRLYGNLITMLTILKGLPMTYNRDLQEDKEPLFDSMDTVSICLEGMIEMLAGVEIKEDAMRAAVFSNFSTATDLADYLARKGVPFRQSHEISGSIVKYCEDESKDFFSLSLEELRRFSSVFEDDIDSVLDPLSSTERKLSMGSTSRNEVLRQIQELTNIVNG